MSWTCKIVPGLVYLKLLRVNSVGGKLAYSCDHVDISATNSTIWNCRMLSIQGNNANRSGLLYTSFLNFEELKDYQKRWIQDSTNQENPSVETFEDCFKSMYYLDRKSDLDCNAYVRAIKYSDIRYQTFTNSDEISDTILVRKRRTRTGEKILFLSMASMRDKILMYSSLSNHIHQMRYQQFYGTINKNGEAVKIQNSFQRAVAYSDLIANDHPMVVERDDGYWVQALSENGEAYHVDHIDRNNVSTNLQVITAAENNRRSASTRDYALASANMKSVKLVFMPEEHSFDNSHGESIPGKMEWEWCSPISSNKEQVDRVQTWTLTIGHYFRQKDGHFTWDHHGTTASLFSELKGFLDVWNVFLRDLNMENEVLYNLSLLAESLSEFRQLLTQTLKPSGMRKGRGSNAKGFDCAVGEQPIQLCHIHKKGLPFQVFTVYCRLRAVSTQPQVKRIRVT